MNLYELNGRIAELAAWPEDEMYIDPETGECMTVGEALTALQMEAEAKKENVVRWLKNIQAEDAAISTELAQLTDRHKALAKKRDELKAWLTMAQTDEDGNMHPYTCAAGKVTFAKNPPSVRIVDDMMIPWTFKEVKTETVVKKDAIKAAIKSGENVPGAELIQERSLRLK